jgi:cystathionine beta-lyase/cystathionine gamma-synthase
MAAIPVANVTAVSPPSAYAEGGETAVTFATGMAAISAALGICQMFLEHATSWFVKPIINVNGDVPFDACFVGSKFDKPLCTPVH